MTEDEEALIASTIRGSIRGAVFPHQQLLTGVIGYPDTTVVEAFENYVGLQESSPLFEFMVGLLLDDQYKVYPDYRTVEFVESVEEATIKRACKFAEDYYKAWGKHDSEL